MIIIVKIIDEIFVGQHCTWRDYKVLSLFLYVFSIVISTICSNGLNYTLDGLVEILIFRIDGNIINQGNWSYS